MRIDTRSPYELALIFGVVPYFFLNIIGLILGKGLWTDQVIVLSSVFLGFIAGETISFKGRLLGLQQKIKDIAVNEEELKLWQISLERNINRKTPFKIGLIIGLLLILPHYYFYGVYFTQKYGLILYVLNLMLIWIPSAIFITYVAWIIIIEYLWIYGMDPKNRPLMLGAVPSPALQRFFETEDLTRLEIKVRRGNITQSGFEPIASLALFGSMLMGVGGAIALPVILIGAESRLLGLLLMTGIVTGVIIAFVYPLKKVYEVLKLEKAANIGRIHLILDDNIKTLESMIFDSSSSEKLEKAEWEEIESITRYIEALKVLESTHNRTRTIPVDMAMVSKLLASTMAPIISFILKSGVLRI